MTHIGHRREKAVLGALRSRGGLTIFSAVLILVLMTLMLLYATRVGLLESRVSANDARQKVAFHAAEAAIGQGVMYVKANSERLFSTSVDAFPPVGNGGALTGDGWLAPAPDRRWEECSAGVGPCDDLATGSLSGTVYYYEADGDAGTPDSVLDVDGLEPGSAARLSALMCVVDLNSIPITFPAACIDVTATSIAPQDLVPMVWLLGYGFSDCADVNSPSATCTGQASVVIPVSTYDHLSGPPSVPWTTKTTWPPKGNATIVGNPNAGGIGLTGAVWANCKDFDPCIDADTGSWQTCELQEWYGTEERPDDVACPKGPACHCNSQEEQLSNKNEINIDIIQDPDFPDDLFEIYFGVPRSEYLTVKNSAQIIEDCTTLNESSSGLYWTTEACAFNQRGGNKVIGSPGNPVILVAAGPSVTMRGTVDFFGVLYLFDGENPRITMDGNGTFRLYGSGIADIGAACGVGERNCGLNKFNGNLHIVYNEDVLVAAAGVGSIGGVSGGWRDFGVPDIAW